MTNQSQNQKKLRDTFLSAMADLFPCIKGSLTEIRKPCIRPNCPKCKNGDKHPAFILTFRKKGETYCRYISKDQVPAIRKAIANGRKIEEQLACFCERLLKNLRSSRKRNCE